MTLSSILQSLLNRQFVKFSITGGANTFLDFTAFIMLFNGGLSIITSNAIAFHIALLCSFLLNKLWVFKNKAPFQGKNIAKFYAISVAVMVLNTALVLGFYWLTISIVISKIVATGITLFINFFALRCLFR